MVNQEAKNQSQQSADESAAFFNAVLAERDIPEPAASQSSSGPQPNEQWLGDNFEGQLAVDVYQTEDSIVVQSTLAGVRVEDIDIAVHSDMITIKGIRHRDESIAPQDYFYQECYWGGFSRSIILPVDVKAEGVAATLKNGILTVILPKAEKIKTRTIKVQEEFDDEEAE